MTLTIVQAVWGEIPEPLQPGPRNVQALAVARGWEYELVQGPALQDREQIRLEWDKFKFLVLATHPNTIMVDLDCILRDSFEHLDDGKPHCAYWPLGNPAADPQPDTHLCYGPVEWWDAQLQEAVERGMLDTPCWPRKLLRDNKDIVQIPLEQYIHKAFTACGTRRDSNTGARIGPRLRSERTA
jgi:hypothetical protein